MTTESDARSRVLQFLNSVVQDANVDVGRRIDAAELLLDHIPWDWSHATEEAAGPISETPPFKDGEMAAYTGTIVGPPAQEEAAPADDEPEEEAAPAEMPDKKEIKFADVLNEFKKLISLEGKEEEAKAVGEALVRSYGVSRARQIPPEKYGEVVDAIDELMGELLGGTPPELLIANLGEHPGE